MSLHMLDGQRAVLGAIVLTGLATVVVFGIRPGGFEGQVGWFFALLPAAFAAYPLSDYIYDVAPRVERIAFWTSLVGFNFLWYWGISYAVIRFGASLKTKL